MLGKPLPLLRIPTPLAAVSQLMVVAKTLLILRLFVSLAPGLILYLVNPGVRSVGPLMLAAIRSESLLASKLPPPVDDSSSLSMMSNGFLCPKGVEVSGSR